MTPSENQIYLSVWAQCWYETKNPYLATETALAGIKAWGVAQRRAEEISRQLAASGKGAK
jgi:hypothetical protein